MLYKTTAVIIDQLDNPGKDLEIWFRSHIKIDNALNLVFLPTAYVKLTSTEARSLIEQLEIALELEAEGADFIVHDSHTISADGKDYDTLSDYRSGNATN